MILTPCMATDMTVNATYIVRIAEREHLEAVLPLQVGRWWVSVERLRQNDDISPVSGAAFEDKKHFLIPLFVFERPCVCERIRHTDGCREIRESPQEKHSFLIRLMAQNASFEPLMYKLYRSFPEVTCF